MSTLLSEICGSTPTALFCLPPADRIIPIPAVIPAVAPAVNTVVEVAGGNALNPVPLPTVAALGDAIVFLYKGGNVALQATGATVYSFDPVADLNKAITVRYDGATWVLA
jgi:hypothetical protein